MGSQDTRERRDGMKRKQEMLKTALFAVCQPHTCTGAATRGHCWNFERGAGNEKRQVPSVVFSGGAVGLQLKFRRKSILKGQ